ncbi:MAG: dienelactone hydrolase [Caulobacterales bacterium 68-7]|nr:dienelactone hydrolase family protein [Caulobacterales bacterium]OJU10572.1 MAG: dienelactone hydrolase [Caulobacterales bacterium 68-7]
MCDHDTLERMKSTPKITRRSFAAITATAAAMAGTVAYGQAKVVEKDVTIKTPDGTADAALFYPEGNAKHAAVLVWADIMGLRPVFREMGRRLASQGYVVLVPNPFYRSAKAADIVAANYDFSNPEGRAKLFGFRSAINDAGVDNDAKAFLAFLDTQPQVDKTKKAGVQGYCMGGPLSFRTAAAVPNRIGAVGSFHGGGLVTKEASSPHLLIAKTNAAYLVAVAENDDKTDPEAKNVLKKTFDDAKKTATVEVYPANHGWCVPGGGAYNAASAEKAWGELGKLYGKALA